MIQVVVHSRIVGALPSDETLPNIVVDLLNEQMTVSELISLTVEEQIRTLLLISRFDAENTSQLLNRQYLSNEEIQQQAASGVICFPAKPDTLPQIDVEAEIAKALKAFEKRTYLILVDGKQAESLDQILTFHATSKVNFMRLTPLVGG